MSEDTADETVPHVGRLAGIDYGTVRVGIAISNPGQTIASPFENYTRRSEELDSQFFQAFIADESIVGFVIGLPIHLSGDESPKSVEARAYGKWLGGLTGLPIAFHDERYTSVDAEAHLMSANLTKKRRKARLDMLAAQMILRSYIEKRAMDRTRSSTSHESNRDDQ